MLNMSKADIDITVQSSSGSRPSKSCIVGHERLQTYCQNNNLKLSRVKNAPLRPVPGCCDPGQRCCALAVQKECWEWVAPGLQLVWYALSDFVLVCKLSADCSGKAGICTGGEACCRRPYKYSDPPVQA